MTPHESLRDAILALLDKMIKRSSSRDVDAWGTEAQALAFTIPNLPLVQVIERRSGKDVVGSPQRRGGVKPVPEPTPEPTPIPEPTPVPTPLPTGGMFPNAPGFANKSEIDFSQVFPAGSGERPIVGSDSWHVIYDNNLSKQSDPTAPHSPPDIWRWRFPKGEHGSLNSSWGVGNIFRHLPEPFPTRLYYGIWVRFDAAFIHNCIGDKFLNVEGGGAPVGSGIGNLLINSRRRLSGTVPNVDGMRFWPLEQQGEFGNDFAVLNGTHAIPYGSWLLVEGIFDIPGKRWQHWLGGVVASDQPFPYRFTHMRTIGLYGARGGGGECSTCSCPPLPRDVWFDVAGFKVEWE